MEAGHRHVAEAGPGVCLGRGLGGHAGGTRTRQQSSGTTLVLVFVPFPIISRPRPRLPACFPLLPHRVALNSQALRCVAWVAPNGHAPRTAGQGSSGPTMSRAGPPLGCVEAGVPTIANPAVAGLVLLPQKAACRD